MSHRFPYRWDIRGGYPAKGIPSHGLTAFGTFACGGGSAMGYKLAGYRHLGGVEIDPRMAACYKANHSPRYMFAEDIRAFNSRTDLPDELYTLGLLDGSPPCSTFSIAGSREAAWGKSKKFREGQASQTLDDLIGVYADTVLKLRPQAFVMENVKGLLIGDAKPYLKNFTDMLTFGGYQVQAFLLNGARMGLPQSRERVFCVGVQAKHGLPKLSIAVNEPAIAFGEIATDGAGAKEMSESLRIRLPYAVYGDGALDKADFRYRGKESFFNNRFVYPHEVAGTIASQAQNIYWPRNGTPRHLTDEEITLAASFPSGYDFLSEKPAYICGMSVPPVMAAHVGIAIYEQWLSKI